MKNNTTLNSFEKIYKLLEEVMLANSGSDEFEEILKLIILKLWDEKHATNSFFNKKKAEKTLLKIEKEWPGVILEKRFLITDEQFTVCKDIIQKFDFSISSYEGIDGIFEYIISKEKKGAKGQFFTPRYIVDFCVDILNPKSNESILDPTVGSGAFLYHSYARTGIKGNQLWGFDFDETAVRIARLLLNIADISGAHIHKVNSLLKPSTNLPLQFSINDFSTTIEDIERIEKKKNKYDVILTNPPFAGEVIEPEILNNYEISRGKNRIERDVLFLERCVNLLNDSGRMAIILPDNVFGGNDNEYVRKWLHSTCRIIGVIGIPRNAFMPHTPVKTSILFVEKRNTKKKYSDEKVFFGICQKPGKDSRGRLIFKSDSVSSWKNVDHDLAEISIEFKKFLADNKIGW